jgi:AraC-like DNA-binding protein
MARTVEPDRVAELHKLGWSQKAIARDLGCSVSAVHRTRKHLGLTATVTRGRRVEGEWRDYLASLIGDGWSFTEIERTTGVSATTLRKHFPGMGWTPAQYGPYGVLRKREKRMR